MNRHIAKIIGEMAPVVEQALLNSSCKEDFENELAKSGYSVLIRSRSPIITFAAPNGYKVRNQRLDEYSKFDFSTERIYTKINHKSGLEALSLKQETKDMTKLEKRLYGQPEDKQQNILGREKIKEFCAVHGIEEKGRRYLYVLALENDFYYVGQTGKFAQRMKRHFVSKKAGSDWSELHPPVALLEVIDMGDMEESSCVLYETAKTISLMERSGVARVRGGDFCFLDNRKIIYLLKTHGYIVKNNKPYPAYDAADRYCEAIDKLKQIKSIPLKFHNFRSTEQA